jgi:hypothetical protein
MYNRVCSGQYLERLPKVRQIRLKVGTKVFSGGRKIHVEHLVAVLEEVLNHPASSLATPTGNHNPCHAITPLNKNF